MGVNFMKCVGLCLVFFKISIELEHAMRLCVALFVCNFRGGHSLCCGWWAVMLQYTMGMARTGRTMTPHPQILAPARGAFPSAVGLGTPEPACDRSPVHRALCFGGDTAPASRTEVNRGVSKYRSAFVRNLCFRSCL